jgi:hypothetical protein
VTHFDIGRAVYSLALATLAAYSVALALVILRREKQQ